MDKVNSKVELKAAVKQARLTKAEAKLDTLSDELRALAKRVSEMEESSEALAFCKRVERAAGNSEELDVFGTRYVPVPSDDGDERTVKDKDGVPIKLGDHVWGGDGVEFAVLGIVDGKYPVVGNAIGTPNCKLLKRRWLTHYKPAMLKAVGVRKGMPEPKLSDETLSQCPGATLRVDLDAEPVTAASNVVRDETDSSGHVPRCTSTGYEFRGKNVFLSGPMTGKPDWNREKFAEVAGVLEYSRQASSVFNPARTAPRGEDSVEPHSSYMVKSISELSRPVSVHRQGRANEKMSFYHCVVLLPGWEDSAGSKLEVECAEAFGIDIVEWVG